MRNRRSSLRALASRLASRSRLASSPRGRAASGLLLCALSCRSESDRACIDAFEKAQAVVMEVEGEKLKSVDESLRAVDGAIASCQSAGRSGEVEELGEARAKLASHRDVLARHEQLKNERRERSPEELARLVRSGDPECPRGQAYLHQKSGKRIRCTGPQPADMPWEGARSYFERRGYKVLGDEAAARLTFEYGGELLHFDYERAKSDAAPRCITVYPPSDRSWQETTARLTGVQPGRLKSGRAVATKSGKRALAVLNTESKVVVWLGQCPEATAGNEAGEKADK